MIIYYKHVRARTYCIPILLIILLNIKIFNIYHWLHTMHSKCLDWRGGKNTCCMPRHRSQFCFWWNCAVFYSSHCACVVTSNTSLTRSSRSTPNDRLLCRVVTRRIFITSSSSGEIFKTVNFHSHQYMPIKKK